MANKSTVIFARVLERDRQLVRVAAESAGVTLSTFVREAALSAARKELVESALQEPSEVVS